MGNRHQSKNNLGKLKFKSYNFVPNQPSNIDWSQVFKPAVFKLTKFSRMPVLQGLKLLVCCCECKDQYHCHRSQLPQTLFNEACMEPTFEAIFSNLNTMSSNEMVYKLFSSKSNGGKFSKIYALL